MTKYKYFSIGKSIELNVDKIEEDMTILVSNLGISVIFLITFLILTWHLRQRIGYSHLILLGWTVNLIIPVVNLIGLTNIVP